MSPVPPDEPALRLCIAFVNSYDLYDDPPDNLTLEWAARLATSHGGADLARDLVTTDLERLRQLRNDLYRVFAADGHAVRIAHLNAVLRSLDARAQLTEDRGLVAATTDRDPVRRLGVLCADALARAVAVGGTQRVGTCAAPPCRCVYIDRTRAARQRYCCDVCNDRAAATAYRARQRQRVAR